MKNIVENKVKSILEKYKYNSLLTLIIFILFLIFGYSNSNINYTVYINDEKVNFTNGIYILNNEQYIHIDDLTDVFADNVYDDKISGKLIITTYNNLVKINKNDDTYVIKENKASYFNLKKIMNQIGYNLVLSGDKIYISNLEYIEGEIRTNRTELLDKQTGSVICLLNKQDKVKIFLDNNIKDESQKVVTVEANINGETYYGYTLKKNVIYEYETIKEVENREKVVLVKSDNKLMTNTDTKNIDMVAINMYRLSGVNTLAKLEYTNNVPNSIKVLAVINNGQKSSNYDADIVTGMLNSESNRYEIIQKIADGVKEIAGVNLDFSNFKLSDKQNYTQFVKELAAVIHMNNKILVVNIPSAQYIDVGEVVKFADYIVLQPYGARTTSSKTSGPISSITYVEQTIQDVIAKVKDVNKLVLELPAYTILWTERRGTVINAEQYNMKTMEAYLEENNIQAKLDSASRQNYINYTKGITTYKMWLEDEYSITQKTELANKYNLAGVSIYRSGMEIKEIYESISKVLKK
ncbi:MAG: hypothetical protein IJ272_01945 [Clostridia bacterium]|nr:hypothetical protein [Clostridia bacterium]